MREFRKMCLCLSLLVGTCGFVSCEKDSDIDETNPISTKTGPDAEQYPTDSIQVNFYLLDMDGHEATTFAYGDNITFSLELTNSSSDDIVVDNDVTVDWIPSSEDLFMVYTKDGQAVGKPWDLFLVHMITKIGSYIMPSGTTWNWNCKWKGIFLDIESPNDYIIVDSYTGTPAYLDGMMPAGTFYQTDEREFLPVGEYYCQFEITLGGNDKRTCRADFRIEENPDVQQGDTINPILEGKVYDSIKEFYNNYYGLDTDYRSFFDNSDKSQCLVINSTEELKNHYWGDHPFPEVDFDKYTLIVGQKMMPESYYSVLRQELISFGDELRLNVYVPKLDGAYTAFQHLFYWGLYPKVHSSSITVKLFKE